LPELIKTRKRLTGLWLASCSASLAAGEANLLKCAASPAFEALRGLDYRAIGAANADAALGILEQPSAKIDLMLTDVIMPGMNGRELSRRAHELRPGLKGCSCPAIRATRLCTMGASTSTCSSFKNLSPCKISPLAFGTCWIGSPDSRTFEHRQELKPGDSDPAGREDRIRLSIVPVAGPPR
jgi:hypothetical protein